MICSLFHNIIVYQFPAEIRPVVEFPFFSQIITGNFPVFLFATATVLSAAWIISRIISGNLIKLHGKLKNIETELAETRQKLLALESRTRDFTDSLVYAQRIQEALLPSESFLAEHFRDFFIFFRPKDIVSGDFYWFNASGDKICIISADCTGHGVPGALMSIIGQNLISQVLNEGFSDNPAEMLSHLDKLVMNVFSKGEGDGDPFIKEGMDIGICMVDYQRHRIEFSGAFTSLYLVSNGKLNVIAGDKQILGIKKDGFSYSYRLAEFKENDIIYFFTDGYADQFGGPENKKFMYRRFRYLLTTINELPLKEQKDILQETFYSWKGDNEQVDDVMVISVRL